jgi:hypothetical protein
MAAQNTYVSVTITTKLCSKGARGSCSKGFLKYGQTKQQAGQNSDTELISTIVTKR